MQGVPGSRPAPRGIYDDIKGSAQDPYADSSGGPAGVSCRRPSTEGDYHHPGRGLHDGLDFPRGNAQRQMGQDPAANDSQRRLCLSWPPTDGTRCGVRWLQLIGAGHGRHCGCRARTGGPLPPFNRQVARGTQIRERLEGGAADLGRPRARSPLALAGGAAYGRAVDRGRGIGTSPWCTTMNRMFLEPCRSPRRTSPWWWTRLDSRGSALQGVEARPGALPTDAVRRRCGRRPAPRLSGGCLAG